jgi:hypothetical protein
MPFDTISKEYFIKRLVDLCLRSGLSGFPTDEADNHILFKSVILILDKSDVFTEKEINYKLEYWIRQISHMKNTDHITLRRSLIDAGYLTRNMDGSCYQVSPLAPGSKYFDDTIEKIDIIQVIKTAQEEIDRRKRAYMENTSIR